MSNWTPWLIIILFAVLQIEAEVNFEKNKLNDILKWRQQQKRPFCNAFTGCGRKRTPYPPFALSSKRTELNNKDAYSLNDDVMNEELSDLIDINSEPAVENVQKQIMSQAKIYEAIKEASKEILRQRNKQKLLNQQRKEQQQYLLTQNGQQDQEQQRQQQRQQQTQQQLDKIEDDEMV